ncbi:MAG: aspartate-semialdehyde dehydrogenase [Syntrophomonadaceae bacterium]|nr:aspartate-semialdehyde dehydrogenase [Syntrophomonadaceae bacterium]
MSEGIRLAVVGATGAVGQQMLKVLEERNFKIKDIICLADPREAGTEIKFRDQAVIVQAAGAEAFKEADIALFAVGTDISKELAPLAVANNCVVIDNSYAFRLDDGVPLVVPEVNPEDIQWHKGIIANPNCSTIIMVMAINPIHRAVGLKRVVVSTYQAVSGAGIAGLEELRRQVDDWANGREPAAEVFQYPISFNLIPHIDSFLDNDYTREEMKMVWETRKIMHAPSLQVAPTTVRVPVYRSHAESIALETINAITPQEVRDLLSKQSGVIVQDDPARNLYPMPLYCSDHDEVFVGRIRKDNSIENGILLWAVSDQIRKGAATNAVQIAKIVVEKGLY